MPEKLKYYQDYNELVELMQKSSHNYDYGLIERAYKFAEEMHGDQRRASGIPYILHPTSVACILTELGMDSESIAAALLHDVVEDTPVTLEEVTKKFGSEIAILIDGVTKLGKIPYSSREEQQAENIRKMLIAMSNDIRVIIIKLADRLHNMRTIECMKEQHRRDKALEVMEVYAPIAHRLGIRAIKEELEDLSIRYLDPVGYSEIERQLELKSKDRINFVAEIKQQLYDRLKDEISNVYIEGRVKSIHGIYKKTYMKGRTMDQIYDIFAVRVIVDSVADCYNVLGVVHDIFKPLPNRFKDYISTPKPNMYQSLHTTVIGKEGIPFEIQIRTWEMHYTAEYGIAAHWKYKEGITKKNSLDDRLAWIRKMLENQSDNDSTDIVRTIKMDLVPEEVFVFTPKGDVLSLPNGATVIDVAYAIHSEVGNRMNGAKVDKRIVPFDYKVKTGEIVEIMTAKESTGPKRDWLNIVRTSEARSKIRLWFKKEKRDENIQEGKGQLEAEFRRLNINVPEKELPEFLADVMHRQNCNTIDDFYASIGYGGIQLWRILPRIKENYFKKYTVNENEPIVVIKDEIPKKKISSGVRVAGLDDCLIKYSKCCNPLPGDDIIGFITRGYGVSIHKRSCTNVPKDISKSPEPERWVSAEWADHIANETFKATLRISATDRTGLLADITNQLSAMHLFIHNLNSRESKNGMAIVEISVTVNGINHLKTVISKLSGINGIVSVGRS